MAGKNIIKAWHRFIQTNFNAFKPSSPNLHKERKYEHIEIQKDFEDIEKKRQLQRLTLIEYKKKLKKQLLEQQLEASRHQAHDLLEQQDRKLAQEVKHAKDTQKYGEHKTFQEFSKTLEDSKRQISQAQTSTIIPEDIEKELAKLSSDIERIRATKQELEVVDKELEELEPGYLLVTDLDKKLVLNAIAYYEFQMRNLQGVEMHPETMKSLEIVHYHVEHNLPVRRELLYEVVPELFESEIGELSQYERERILAKRPRLINRSDAIVRAVDEPPEEKTKGLDAFEEFKKQEMDFMEFVYAKAGEFSMKHEDYLDSQITGGFGTIEAVLEHIENKAEDKRSEMEQQIFTDLQELRRINNDYADLIKLNRAKIFAKQREPDVPEFIKQSERLHKIWLEKWEEFMQYSFDIKDSILVPDNSANHESRLEKVLYEQRLHDINDLIAQSQEEYKMRAADTEPHKPIDRSQKNTDLLRRLDVLTGAMNQVPTKRKVKTRNIEHFQSGMGRSEMSEEGRILLEEYTKVLFLNNKDPAKYNIIFWAEHFNILPSKLRNIFNFITFGLPDQKNPKDIGRVLRFIYDNSTLTAEQKEHLGEVPASN